MKIRKRYSAMSHVMKYLNWDTKALNKCPYDWRTRTWLQTSLNTYYYKSCQRNNSIKVKTYVRTPNKWYLICIVHCAFLLQSANISKIFWAEMSKPQLILTKYIFIFIYSLIQRYEIITALYFMCGGFETTEYVSSLWDCGEYVMISVGHP